MSILLLFIDGVGLGEPDPAINPLVAARTPALHRLLGGPLVGTVPIDVEGALMRPTDATLGVPGLPQSATGQTALLTGVNAPALVGRHVAAYPTAALRDLLKTQSIFARAVAAGRRVTLANAYTSEYHQAVEAGRLRQAVITYAAVAAGLRLRTVDDLRRGEAVFHDLTNARPRAWDHDVPRLTPADAGRNLARLAAAHDLTVFEFFLTDLAAHGRIHMTPVAVVEMVDGLVGGVLEHLTPAPTLVITSDHGNLEDARSDVHTRNPVPTIAAGPARDEFRSVASLTDTAPAILRVIGAGQPVGAGSGGDGAPTRPGTA